MRRHFLFHLTSIVLILLSATIHAQQTKWSQQLQDNKKLPYLKILGSDDDGFYIPRSNISFATDRDHVGFKSRKYALSYFGNEMNAKWDHPFNAEKEENKIVDVNMINGKVLVVSSATDKQNKVYTLLAQYLNNKGAYEGQAMKLDEFGFEKIDEDNKPDVISSHNQLLTALAYRKLSKEKDEQFYEAVVFDTNLTVIYRKEINVPVKTKLFSPVDFVLTDEGNFYLLGIKFTTEKRVKAPGESFYELYSFNNKKDSVTTHEIKSGDKFLTDVSITADNLNHKIVVAGFYSDATTYSVAGVFYYSVGEDDSTQTAITNSPFSPEFLRKFIGERKENHNTELTNYSIDRIVLRKDGGAVIVAESFYITTRSYWDYYSQMFMSHRYYHYGNILMLSTNPDGTILWGDVISKDQNSTDDGGVYSSYSSAINDGKMFYVYNKFISDPSSVLITNIDGNGEQNTKVLFNEVENVSVIPRSAQQIDEETWVLPVYRENKFFLVKLSW